MATDYSASTLDEGGTALSAPPEWQSFTWNPDGSFSIVSACPAGTVRVVDAYGNVLCVPVSDPGISPIGGGDSGAAPVEPSAALGENPTSLLLLALVAFWLLKRL
jgi:hypothetical protein